MTIILNNSSETINAEKISIKELLTYKNFTFKLLVVKINGKLIKKQLYEETYIYDGDEVVVLHLISGG